MTLQPEFSFRTRRDDLARLRTETFDVLVIGAGITGAAVAREAASRGLRTALVDRGDLASGTSSASAKLVHGGLRYLATMDLTLVRESLRERRNLLVTAPHLVRPIAFHLPVRKGDRHGMALLGAGLWAYDVLAGHDAPGHRTRLSADELARAMPELDTTDLVGGWRYVDATMWDDALVMETARDARALGAAVVTRCEPVSPVFADNRVAGFRVRDLESGAAPFELRAERVIACAGPWTDRFARQLDPAWQPRLRPSQGVHLVLPLERLKLPGAVILEDHALGRAAYALPRPDLGAGVIIVGTTETPVRSPEEARVRPDDVTYLIALLQRHFPSARLDVSDVVGAYVGVRPLAEDARDTLGETSRDHVVETGPGDVVLVYGGKYTTHRRMARDAVRFTIDAWRRDARRGVSGPVPALTKPERDRPVNPAATLEAITEVRPQAPWVPESLWRRYGAEAVEIARLGRGERRCADPEGFPCIAAQLRHAIRREGVLHLEDFWFRRVPLFLARRDHALPWADALARVWAEETGRVDARQETERLVAACRARSSWREAFPETVRRAS